LRGVKYQGTFLKGGGGVVNFLGGGSSVIFFFALCFLLQFNQPNNHRQNFLLMFYLILSDQLAGILFQAFANLLNYLPVFGKLKIVFQLQGDYFHGKLG
jgi:hypothetical protein